jgi:hypothetical protein
MRLDETRIRRLLLRSKFGSLQFPVGHGFRRANQSCHVYLIPVIDYDEMFADE